MAQRVVDFIMKVLAGLHVISDRVSILERLRELIPKGPSTPYFGIPFWLWITLGGILTALAIALWWKRGRKSDAYL